MGFFTDLFSSKQLSTPIVRKEIIVVRGAAEFELHVTGAENFQAALQAICGRRHPKGVNRTEMASLILEFKNRRDNHTVRVEIQGRTVGYLAPEAAALYRQHLLANGMAGAHGQCLAAIRGGWISSDERTGPYEVWLDFPILCRQR